MRSIKHIIWILLVVILKANAQSNIDSVLADISRNNYRIKSNVQFQKSEQWHARTGISLYNPVVEYDYLNGSPAEAGKQEDFTFVQSFDFPSVYTKKRKLADIRSGQLGLNSKAVRQEVLIEAKQIYFDIIYHKKLQVFLSDYAKNAQQLVSDFQKKLDKGDGNILDLNKSKLILFDANKDLENNRTALLQLNQSLVEMNGGNVITVNDTFYPLIPLIEPFDQLEQEIENNDPIRQSLETEVAIAKLQVSIARASSLPKMEVGYHYQGILGQTFSGFHTGITIPLWENRNGVRYHKEAFIYAELELQTHKSEHYTEIKNLYERYLNLKKLITEYDLLLNQVNQGVLLSKAVFSGHISTIEYFMEMSLLKNSTMGYFRMENELHKVLAELYKFKL
jgi:hypothetical protein